MNIEPFTNPTFSDILKKYPDPLQVMKLWQEGNHSLEIQVALQLHFPKVEAGAISKVNNMCGPQKIYVSKVQEVRENGKDKNNKNTYEYGEEWLKVGRCNSLKNRYSDKRGGFKNIEDYKVWEVYPLAAMIIDEDMKDGRLGVPSESIWKGTKYGKSELYCLDTYNANDFIKKIKPIISKYNIDENNKPKRVN